MQPHRSETVKVTRLHVFLVIRYIKAYRRSHFIVNWISHVEIGMNLPIWLHVEGQTILQLNGKNGIIFSSNLLTLVHFYPPIELKYTFFLLTKHQTIFVTTSS